MGRGLLMEQWYGESLEFYLAIKFGSLKLVMEYNL